MNRNNSLFFILGTLFIIFVWFISSEIIDNNAIIPSINEVINKFGVILNDKTTYIILGNTFLKILLTLVFSFLIALIFAVLSLINEKIEYFIRPTIVLFKSIPVVAIVMILLLVFFKQDVRFLGTMITASFVMMPIIYESILVGFKSIDPWIIKSTRVESKMNFNVLRKIIIPLAIPNIFSGLLASFGMGLKVLVMSEVIMNPNDSLGQLIGLYASFGELGMVFAYSILLIVMVILTDYVVKLVNKKLI